MNPNRENKLLHSSRFIEVGISVNGFEFYHEFCIPVNLSMRRYNPKSMAFDVIRLEDWLSLDFPTILARRLFALNGNCHIEVISIKNIVPTERPLSPVVRGDSRPQSWVDTFVFLIASYFVNNYHHGRERV